ncbi:MAG: homocysteine S-methyltransferase family protein, partial [Acidimicrobiia bacterium]
MTTTLPQLHGRPFVTDGGLETTLLFHDGIDLPDFAAFPLLDTEDGRAALRRYYDAYVAIARRLGTGIVLDTPTWRASLDWGARLGYDADALAEVNRRAVAFVGELAAVHDDVPTVRNGVIGPRGDGYVVGSAMSADEAASYHALQARAFAEAGADMVTAVTMTYSAEATGIVRAATAAGLSAVISFTVETDGRLPSGESLGDAIEAVDAQTEGAAAYFMVNCAHPSHFADVLAGPWTDRIRGIRANASKMSHAELDEAEELDEGDIDELARDYAALAARLPGL